MASLASESRLGHGTRARCWQCPRAWHHGPGCRPPSRLGLLSTAGAWCLGSGPGEGLRGEGGGAAPSRQKGHFQLLGQQPYPRHLHRPGCWARVHGAATPVCSEQDELLHLPKGEGPVSADPGASGPELRLPRRGVGVGGAGEKWGERAQPPHVPHSPHSATKGTRRPSLLRGDQPSCGARSRTRAATLSAPCVRNVQSSEAGGGRPVGGGQRVRGVTQLRRGTCFSRVYRSVCLPRSDSARPRRWLGAVSHPEREETFNREDVEAKQKSRSLGAA